MARGNQPTESSSRSSRPQVSKIRLSLKQWNLSRADFQSVGAGNATLLDENADNVCLCAGLTGLFQPRE